MSLEKSKHAAWLVAALVLADASASAQSDDVEIEIDADEDPSAPPSEANAPSSGEAPTRPNEANGATNPSSAPASSGAPARTADPRDAELAVLRATVTRLAGRLAALEAEPRDEVAVDESAGEDEAPSAASEPEVTRARRIWDALGLRIGGYIQVQLEQSQLSADEIAPGGGALNQDRFLIRRGRLRIDRTWDYASLAFELDASTTRGPFVGPRRAELSFFYPSQRADAPPFVMVTAGLTEVPFGYELRQNARTRWFMERSTGSLAFQRGEPDVGVRLSGGLGPFRYALAVMNGSPLDDRAGGASVDFNHAKDVVGRFGIETRNADRFELVGGVSFQVGRGFHPGTEATKDQLVWSDFNENGTIEPIEISAIPGSAATPSSNFDRWAVNADVGLAFRTAIGETRVYGEVTMASNLDRSLFVADPVTTGYDLRELAWYAAFLQEISEYAIVGFRADYYDPDSDATDARRGVRRPANASILTLSPLVGAALPGRGRLVFQYDFVRDHLARDARGLPTDLRNDHFTLRLQMEF